MSERDTQISRDVSVDVEPGIDDSVSQDSDTDGEKGRLRQRVEGILSVRAFVISLSLMVVTMVLFGAVPFLGIAGNVLGILAAGFIYGVGTDSRRYMELALAGALAGGGSVLLGNLVFVLVGSGLTLAALGVTAGAIAGAVGHYFGRDLRHGLTSDLSELEN